MDRDVKNKIDNAMLNLHDIKRLWQRGQDDVTARVVIASLRAIANEIETILEKTNKGE